MQQLSKQVDDFKELPAAIMDPTQDEASAPAVQALYRFYVVQQLSGKGFYDDELNGVEELKRSLAKKYIRHSRGGEAKIPMPYVCKNGPLVQSLKPYQDVLCARGTMEMQKSRAIFWRRWLTEADLDGKLAEGWDGRWIDEVRKTKGNISAGRGRWGRRV